MKKRSKVTKPKPTKQNERKLYFNTTWQIFLTGLVYFLIITFLLSTGAFISDLHIELGEPSPQQITAPYDMDIEDLEKYRTDQEIARKTVEPVYKADETFSSTLAKEISTAFLTLNEAAGTNADLRTTITALKKNKAFAPLTDGVLTSLLDENREQGESQANAIIIGLARNVEEGAKTEEEVPALKEKMKNGVQGTELNDNMKLLLNSLIDTIVTQKTLVVDEDKTQQKIDKALADIKLEIYRYKKNQKIVGAGDIVDEKVYRVLAAYGLVKSSPFVQALGGMSIIVLSSLTILGMYLYQYKRSVAKSLSKIILLGLTMTLALVLGKGIASLNLGGAEYNNLVGMMIPVAWSTMAVAILIDIDLAFIVAAIQALFVATMVDPTLTTSAALQSGVVALFSGIAGVFSISRLSQRSDLARGGLYISAANIVIISGMAVASGMRPPVWLVGMLLGIVNGLASSVLTVGTLHWFESGFKITSSIRLLELSNPNRPLLKRLLMEAPGTYHHSILVGNLAEAAAEVVNADPILVRVGAMYHDIGKLKRPYFFIENQFAQDNPHAKIAPTLSALIITSHVKDGLELAKEYKLPQPIQDIIAQHHGDGLVTFFYHRALEEHEEVPEETFRYDGPKPQTKEAALVCLADSVEAAVRSMKQPTPGRIEGLVRKIIRDRLNAGQLDQCDLTLQDLDRIAMAFVRVLSGIFHSRVEYPELPSKGIQDQTGKKRTGSEHKREKKENDCEQSQDKDLTEEEDIKKE